KVSETFTVIPAPLLALALHLAALKFSAFIPEPLLALLLNVSVSPLTLIWAPLLDSAIILYALSSPICRLEPLLEFNSMFWTAMAFMVDRAAPLEVSKAVMTGRVTWIFLVALPIFSMA